MPNDQTMPRDGVRNDSDSTEKRFAPSRRSYLKAAGAAAVSVPLLSGEGAAATERHGISFDNVVDMVEAGADPNGNEACDGALQSAAGSNTLLKFPSGTYKFTGTNSLNDYSNFGILGEGDVTFVVPDDFDDKILSINYGTGALVENITVDQSNATPCVQVAPNDGLEVHGLEMRGEGISSATSGHGAGGGEAENAFNPMVRSSGGEGMVENITLHNEGRMGAYSRVGVWIGQENKGTITLRNCNVEGFSGNGVYASRTPGVVKVEGGLYKNNDLSQVRIGSSGSYIEGVTAEVDLSESRSDNPGEMLNGSGFRLESDRGGSGAEIRNCDVRIGSEVNADGGIQIFGNYGDFTIEDTRVEYNPQGYSIRAKPGGSGSATLRNVSVTGDATDWVGVLIEDRPGTTVENCCIQQTGSGRTGLALENCAGSTVENCTINAGAQAVRIRNGDASVSGIEKSGTCPAPNLGSSSYDGSSSSSSDDSSTDESSSDDTESSSDDSDDSSESSDSSDEESAESSDSSGDESDSSDDSDDSSEDSSSDSSEDDSNDDGAGSDEELSGDIDESDVPEPSDSANFVVTDTDSSGGRIPYEVQTSGDIEKAGTGDATQDPNDEISGKTASGGVNEWRDAYEYEGEIVALEVDDRATIKLDGDEKTITVMGDDDSGTDYSLEVTGTLEHADDSTDPIADDGSSVSGGVGSFRDEYTYTGSLLQASIEDSVSITTDPETLEG